MRSFLAFLVGWYFISFSVCVYAVPSLVSGKFINAQGTNKVYLYEAHGAGFFLLDSTQLLEGKFAFELENVNRGFYRIGINKDVSVVVILGEPRVFIYADLQNPQLREISDSPENEVLTKYQELNHNIYTQKFQAEQLIKSGYKGTQTQDYRELIQGLKHHFDSLDDSRNEFYRELGKKHPDLFMGKICRFLTYDDPASYFDLEELNDPELWRGDMIQAKLFIYFQRLLPRNINHWVSNANKLLSGLEIKSASKEITYGAIISLFATVAPKYATRFADRYFLEYPVSRYAQVINSVIPKGPPTIGDVAPDIELDEVDGQPRKLSSLKGEVVLVDFWASWCGPCRVENPNLVRAYKKYKNKGFTIFSVSLDHSRDKWTKAIDKDKLTWYHVSDLKGWHSGGAKLYQVRAIPASYLVDANGVIIARDLRGDKLTSTLDRILE